ncbi:DUF2249 domain-containing protein [Flavihumibacter fluvii]|uniref:DUF2249 domain-containing protein n=1 Tax=Flavihumibacter fluvii TaxID=2838157 RepID=UPI001BDF2619|nr:DUF2249 domain-containing protein [Flavihumibacter fluvii]ULQ51791.1 DUF2249 domain-containing protein [Flavihumibacter fluvii]
MTINAQTKIATLLRQNAGALEAIVRLSPKFTKLRNPFLRKVIASRTSIATASKLGGCSIEDFFNTLQPLGFDIDRSPAIITAPAGKKEKPAILENFPADKILELDVRGVIEAGKDPLDIILKKLKALQSGFVLKIVNSFEPTPLIGLLKKRGYSSYTEDINENLVFTWFYQEAPGSQPIETIDAKLHSPGQSGSWTELMKRYKNHLETIDVRNLPMPLPMQTILEALENLPPDKALHVYHKRIPVFLLPELHERKLSYCINEISDSEVELLIYSEQHV